MNIVIDTREQRPLQFPLEINCVMRGMKTGDYTIDGYEDTVLVERKGLGDLIGCLTTGRNRFRKQLARLKKVPYRIVMIESSLFQISRKRYVGYLTPDEVIQAIADLSTEYKIPFQLTDNPQLTARMCLAFLSASKKLVDEKTPRN